MIQIVRNEDCQKMKGHPFNLLKQTLASSVEENRRQNENKRINKNIVDSLAMVSGVWQGTL